MEIIREAFWTWKFFRVVFVSGLLALYAGCHAVLIRRLNVPRSIENGTEEYTILDCDYVYNENDIRLVVKWFFEDNTEPVYQWIPQLNRTHVSGVLEGRLDRGYRTNVVDPYSWHRALKILRPSTELSGKYTCLVTSLAGQDSKEQTMTVYVPAHEFELRYVETHEQTVNVTCEALGVFPFPVLQLHLQLSSGSPPQPVPDAEVRSRTRPGGSHDVRLHRTFTISELPSKGGTVFQCELRLPGTNYQQSKRIAYFPGIQGLEKPYGLSSISNTVLYSNIFLMCGLAALHLKKMLHISIDDT